MPEQWKLQNPSCDNASKTLVLHMHLVVCLKDTYIHTSQTIFSFEKSVYHPRDAKRPFHSSAASPCKDRAEPPVIQKV